VALALLAITQPGDTIAIESPTNFSFLQLLKELGVMVMEVPTDPRDGVDMDELEKIFCHNRIKACLFMPNFHNPLGTVMSADSKQRLVRLLDRYEIPAIEDDISAELYFDEPHPKPLKAFDRKGWVLTCSSFSKTLAPGLRIGWIIPGRRFKEKILRLKGGTTVSTATLNQYLVMQFLASGAYERHLRFLRPALKKQAIRTTLAVKAYFPPGSRLAVPKGGSFLWIQLNPVVDAARLYRKALDHYISVIPGVVCSNSKQFKNYIQLSYGAPFTRRMEKGIQTLGGLISEYVAEGALSDE
jgi:DNA-binding transcriptional MocR family regulator